MRANTQKISRSLLEQYKAEDVTDRQNRILDWAIIAISISSGLFFTTMALVRLYTW